jgi:hypothetical protein
LVVGIAIMGLGLVTWRHKSKHSKRGIEK